MVAVNEKPKERGEGKEGRKGEGDRPQFQPHLHLMLETTSGARGARVLSSTPTLLYTSAPPTDAICHFLGDEESFTWLTCVSE